MEVMMMMSQTGVSILKPTLANAISQRNFKNPKTLNLRASISNPNFPLASRIMVTNLGHSISEATLQKEFSDFGEIAEVKLVKDEAIKRSKPYAFIQYTSQDDAILALENMDHKTIDGRLIFVDLAKPGKDRFRGNLKTCGPPKKQHVQDTQDEVADCWY
uniref:RRM domain-containing protein n=1 Tax=Salix viminalis TaxID=40686 RepID=A0A6N2MTX2_SALVM